MSNLKFTRDHHIFGDEGWVAFLRIFQPCQVIRSATNRLATRNQTLAVYAQRLGVTSQQSHDLSHSMRKSVLGVCDQVSLKPACSATETSGSLEISDLASTGIVLSRKWTAKALIRMRRCAGWSVSLLFAHGINRFSHDLAHMDSTSYMDSTTVQNFRIIIVIILGVMNIWAAAWQNQQNG